MDAYDIALAIGAGIVASALVMHWLMRGTLERRTSSPLDSELSFLFQGNELIDASIDASHLLGHANPTWPEILQLFHARFAIPDVALDFGSDVPEGVFKARDESDGGTLEISSNGDFRRLEIKMHGPSGPADLIDLNERLTQLSIYRSAVETTPVPIWQLNESGEVAWSNSAYDTLSNECPQDPDQSEKPIFKLGDNQLASGKIRRVKLKVDDARQEIWFDVYRTQTNTGDFYSALDADAVVRAEIAQRNFVQTLAKTFAQLPIGLTIFDENRQLVLFNPALIDLTGLSAEFLSARPNLLTFFDELRDRRLMPEPKDYSSWRQQIADLVVAASDGRYSETWTLPNARTYRVNGRPHPDGAIAFLIEDISAEVSLTRSFRAELELSQAVFDSLESGIAVFSSTGLLTMTNEAYRSIWNVDPDSSFAETTILDCQRDWQAKSQATPVLGELRDFVLNFGERSAWSAEFNLLDGDTVSVSAVPLVSGTTMVKFTEKTAPPKAKLKTVVSMPVKA